MEDLGHLLDSSEMTLSLAEMDREMSSTQENAYGDTSLASPPKKIKIPKCGHPERKVYAFGNCQQCYRTLKRLKIPMSNSSNIVISPPSVINQHDEALDLAMSATSNLTTS